jgi:hypothetical protein
MTENLLLTDMDYEVLIRRISNLAGEGYREGLGQEGESQLELDFKVKAHMCFSDPCWALCHWTGVVLAICPQGHEYSGLWSPPVERSIAVTMLGPHGAHAYVL